MTAYEISQPSKTTIRHKPVFVQDVLQPALRCLTAPLDVRCNGIVIRLQPGTVLVVVGGGAGGVHASLGCDVEFRALDGQTYRATKGMQVLIPDAQGMRVLAPSVK